MAAPTSSSSKTNFTESIQAGRFPPTFNIYRHAKFSRTYYLGEGLDTPLYALTYHGSDSSGQPQVILHDGPEDDSPPLSMLSYDNLQSPMIVYLDEGRREEPMDYRMSFPYLTYYFSIEVLSGEREKFEWRHSSGTAIASLGADKSGWKLVRVESNGATTGGTSDDAKGGDPIITSDGKEVVAALAKCGKGSEEARFAFSGSGRSGILGKSWAVMAVTTAMGIFQRDRSNIRGRR